MCSESYVAEWFGFRITPSMSLSPRDLVGLARIDVAYKYSFADSINTGDLTWQYPTADNDATKAIVLDEGDRKTSSKVAFILLILPSFKVQYR